MLGRRIDDPEGIEGPPDKAAGLGFLDVKTVMKPEKRLALVSGHHVRSGETVTGYEIHIGTTGGPDCKRPVFDMCGRPEGAQSADGRVYGTYMHGMFAEDGFRTAFLRGLGAEAGGITYEAQVDETLNGLAAHLEQHLNIDGLLTAVR